MKALIVLFSLTFIVSRHCCAQAGKKIAVPAFDDKYSHYVRQLEEGETDIDYQDFRFSFLESAQYPLASAQSAVLDSLKDEMYAHMKQKDYPAIISITRQMLSIDYTSMIAHKILRQTFQYTGDSINAAKYKTIQFGLLNSIVKKGDGKSCATAWPVIAISEEYFILQMIDAQLKQQSIDNAGGLCDKMEVTEDGADKTYFFETTKVFEGYKKLGIN